MADNDEAKGSEDAVAADAAPEPGAAEAGAAFADGILARAEENSRGGAGAEREAESKWRALGAGAKLGDGSADDAAAPAAPAADDVGEPLDVRVTFFADGFTVEEDPNGAAAAPPAEPAPRRAGIATLRDGAPAARRPRFEPPPLRAFDAPDSAEFLAHLDRDEVPPSLRRVDLRGRARRVRFGVADARPLKCPWGPNGPLARRGGHDHDHDDDDDDDAPAPPPAAPAAFAGAGQTLGGSAAPPAAADDGGDLPASPVVDAAKPSAKLQLRLANGKRVAVTLNLDHTVRHLRRVVADHGAGDAPYALLAGFPPKPLDDNDATVEAAGLNGVAVSQKLC